MTRLRLLIVSALSLWALTVGSSVSAAATVNVAGGAITATSLGLVSLVKGGTNVFSAVTLTGTISTASYSGTLGVTLWDNIGILNGGSCTSSTANWTTLCLIGAAAPWLLGARVNGNIATILIRNAAFRIINPNASVDCLIVANVTGDYTRGGLLVITSTTRVSESGSCPIGTPALRGTFGVTPAITWTLS